MTEDKARLSRLPKSIRLGNQNPASLRAPRLCRAAFFLFAFSPHGEATMLPPEVDFLERNAISLSRDPELF